MELVKFDSWPEVMAYAKAGRPLYYQAPMDHRATRFLPGSKQTFTYAAQGRTIRLWPGGSIGRGRSRTADPFNADSKHLDRFSHPAEQKVESSGVVRERGKGVMRMPRGIHKDAQHLHDILVKGVLLKKDRVEGSVDLNDEDPVYVGIIVDVNGYGPHVGAMYVEQSRSPRSDSALQGADEILEQWTLDNTSKEDIEELEAEYGDDWMSVLTETFDGWAFQLSPQDFVEAIRGTDAEKLIDIEPLESEEEEIIEESRVSEPNDARDILDGLGQYMQHEGHDAPRESARIARMIAGVRGNSDRADKVLEEVNRLVNGHGIEAIRDENAWDRYYGDVVALYVNMGDTYEATLIYDTEANEFQVTSWGDWYEAYEAERDSNKEEEVEPDEELEETRRHTEYGINRDYPKIDIYVSDNYVATTTWARTLKEAIAQYVAKHRDVDPRSVTASFQIAKKRRAQRRH